MKISLGWKLTGLFLVILIVGLGTTAYFSYEGIYEGLFDKTDEELKAINSLKGDKIEDYFKEVKNSIKYLSNFETLEEEVPKLAAAYNQAGIESQEYKRSVKEINTGVEYFADNEKWNDIYLIDTKGNVIYSSDKGKDYGTNLISGTYQESSLAKAYQQGKKQLSFIDFNYYEPSGTQVGFVSAPVIDQNGSVLGVAALEFPISRINEIMHRESGLEEHGESYLVGPDHLMRSKSEFLEENTMMSKQVNNGFVDKVLSGESGVSTYTNYRGVEVLGSYMPLEVFDQKWGLFVEANRSHILKPVNDLMRRILWIVGITILIAVLITIVVVKFMISNPIHKVRDVLDAVTKKDLTKEVDYSSSDELGKMSQDLNNTVRELNNIIREVRSTVINVSSASDKLSNENNNLSKRTQDVASSLEEISATVQQISASMEDIASHSNKVNELSGDNMEAIKKGSEIIDETKEEIEAMDNLSSKISEIIVIINDIAAQTKLLSMNAAIEAAKADQNGEGFAVVATEVGELADQTSNSAKEINSLIQNIITGINESTEQIKVVDEMFDQIVENSSQVYRGIDQISSSTEEQSSAVEQMQEALEELNLSTQKNTQLVEDIAQSSENLNQDAEKMDELVNEFKVKDKNYDLLKLLKQDKFDEIDELQEENLDINLGQLNNLNY
ncbi:MAG: methyl-accepting chemotaxis protein [Bacillota bacterium]